MPLNVIKAPTNISNTSVAIDPPQITALSNGGYAVAYDTGINFGNGAFSAVFDAQGQFVGGSEVPHNVTELTPDLAGLSGGGYAMAWENGLDGDVYTAVFSAQGQQLAAAVDISNSPGPNTFDIFPAVNALSNGGYVVTWEAPATLGHYDIMTAIYNAQGQQVVAPINVSNTPDIDDEDAVVAVLSNGNYSLTWTSGTLNHDFEIFTAVYNSQGQQVSAPVNVSQNAAFGDGDVRVAALSNGDYALTWSEGVPGGGQQILTAVYDALGQQVVAPVTVGPGEQPYVAALANGNYALSWSNGDVFTAIYDSQGHQVSAPLDVSNSAGQDFAEQVTALSSGAYVLDFQSEMADGSFERFIAVFDADGHEVVAPLDIGLATFNAEVTAMANNAFALTWLDPTSFDYDAFTAVYQFVDSSTPGDVSLIGSPDIAIDLSALVNVGGSLTVTDNGAAVSIDLSNLASIGGHFKLSDNGALLTIVVPALSSVGGYVDISGDGALGSVSLPSLTSVGNVSVDGDGTLTTVYVPLLSDAGDVSVSGDGALGSVSLPSLTSAGDISVSGDGALGSVSLPVLTSAGNVSVGGDGTLTTVYVPVLSNAGDVSVNGDGALGSVSLPSLTRTGDISVSGDGALGSVSLPVLTSAGNVSVGGDGALTTVYVPVLSNAGDVSVSGDGALGSVSLPSLTSAGDISVGGDGTLTTVTLPVLASANNVNVGGNTAVITIDLGALVRAGGIIIDHNGVITLNLSALVKVGGDVEINNNDHLLTVDMPNLTDVTGDVNASNNDSATSVTMHALSTVGGNVDVTADSSATTVDLGSLTSAGGSVDVTANSSATTVDLGSLTTVGGSVDVTANSSATTVDLGSLTSAGGSVDVTANSSATTIALGSLTTVGGSVDVTANSSATTVDLGSLTTVGGSVDVTANSSATTVDLGSLTSAGGSVDVTANSSATTVDLGSLTSAGGSVDVTANSSATTVDLGSLTSAGGSVDVTANSSATTVDLGSLTTVGGSVDVTANSSATTVDLGSLTSAGGSVDVTANSSATTIALGSLTTVGGSVDVTADSSATTIDLGSLDSVAGDVTVAAAPDAKVDASGLGPGGGSVVLIGDITTTVTVGSLTDMTGTLTISSSDGVTVSAKAGLANIGITGTASDDVLIGSTKAANTMDGGGGNDSLTGGSADDVITGGAGNDTLDGKGGINTAVYSGNFSDYAVVQNADGSLTVTDTRVNSPDGTDTLRNFELLKFADGTHTLADVLPPPVITSNGGGDTAAISIPENTAAVTQVTATDLNAAQTLAFAIAGGADAAKFQIDPASGVLSFVAAPNFEAPTDAGANNVYDVIVQVSDGFHFDTQALAVTVTNVNEAPVVAALSGTVGEDGPSFSRDLLTGASDPDQGTVLTVQNLDASVTTAGGRALALGTDYTLNGSTVALTAAGFAKFNSLSGSQSDQVVFHFSVSDGLLTTPNTLALIVTGANDAPLVVPQTASVGEDGPSFSRDLLTGASDPDAGDHLSVLGLDASVTTAGGRALALGTDYTLNGSTLALTAAGFAKFNSLSGSQTDQAIFHFGVSDGTVATADTLTLTVTGADDAPFLASQTANQSATAGTPFALILPANTFQDPDNGDHLTLAATASNGTALPAWLSFNPTTGAFSGTAGPGDVGAFDVRVTATDTGGLTATDTFHFTVAAPSTGHPPVITSDGGGDAASIIITDDSKYIATVHAVDPDRGTTLSYSIIGGSDQKLFTIDPNTGVLSFKSTPQDGHSYQVTVAASDGSLKDTQAIAVHVANGPLEFSNPGVADTFVFKPHFGLAVVNNFDPTSANHDVIQFDHALFHNADVNASPAAILNLIEDHSYQLGRDVVIVTDTHDVIDLRNTSLHSLTAHDFTLT